MAFSFHISMHSASSFWSLVDRGANGGFAGTDVCVLERAGRKVSVTHIADHELPGLDIMTCVVLFQLTMERSTYLCMNMHTMAEVIPSIILVRLNGSTMNARTNLTM